VSVPIPTWSMPTASTIALMFRQTLSASLSVRPHADHTAALPRLRAFVADQVGFIISPSWFPPAAVEARVGHNERLRGHLQRPAPSRDSRERGPTRIPSRLHCLHDLCAERCYTTKVGGRVITSPTVTPCRSH